MTRDFEAGSVALDRRVFGAVGRLKLLLGVLVSTFGLALSSAADATIVFSDLGPSDSYSSGYESVQSPYASPANSFQSSGAYKVTEIDIALGYAGGSPNAATVSLWTDVANAPSTMLGSWSVSNQPAYGTYVGSLTSITGISGIQLEAGSNYFLQIASAGTTFDTWNLNNQGYRSDVDEYGVYLRTDAAGAFRVIGDAAAVPEPSTWAMLILGLASVGAGLRVRRSREVRAAVFPALG